MTITHLTILGSTGSIGKNALQLIDCYREHFKLIALTAHHNVALLFEQCLHFKPDYAVISCPKLGKKLFLWIKEAKLSTQVLIGQEGLVYVASLNNVDKIVAAITGGAGLLPALAAVRAGKCLLLANKEALVMGGHFFMEEVKKYSATLLPLDSEHNAILQCLPDDYKVGETNSQISKIILTASGGAIREIPLHKLCRVTPQQACNHPNWAMGAKITVDSATMMNKALEVIEASWLFGLMAAQIEVVLHPQSIIHSLVEYKDGAMLAQLSNPDMRLPLAQALHWPHTLESGIAKLDLLKQNLEFFPLDLERYPCLSLAYQALKAGSWAPVVLNAANEVAADAFLHHRLSFLGIYEVCATVLEELTAMKCDTLEQILECDQIARNYTHEAVLNISANKNKTTQSSFQLIYNPINLTTATLSSS